MQVNSKEKLCKMSIKTEYIDLENFKAFTHKAVQI